MSTAAVIKAAPGRVVMNALRGKQYRQARQLVLEAFKHQGNQYTVDEVREAMRGQGIEDHIIDGIICVHYMDGNLECVNEHRNEDPILQLTTRGKNKLNKTKKWKS